MKKTKRYVSGYLTSNPSDMWVLVVDGLFGVFESQSEAEHWCDAACPEDEYIENTPFCYVVLIPPHYVAESWDPTVEIGSVDVSLAIDIKRYIQKRHVRLPLRAECAEIAEMIKRKAGQYLRKSGSPFTPSLRPVYKNLAGLPVRRKS